MTKRRTPIKARTYRKRRSTRSRTTRRGRTARRGRLNEMERRLKVSKRRNTRRRNVNRRNTRGGTIIDRDKQMGQYAEDVTKKLRELEDNLRDLKSMGVEDGGMESLIRGLGDLVVKNVNVVENGGELMKGLINELNNLVANQIIKKENEAKAKAAKAKEASAAEPDERADEFETAKAGMMKALLSGKIEAFKQELRKQELRGEKWSEGGIDLLLKMAKISVPTDDLRAALDERGLDTKGEKEDLVKRLVEDADA